MFDIGFSELMVIGVVALIVLGPEKLPRAAKTVGHLMGRMQRYVNDVKADINREMELEELRKFKQQVEETAQTFKTEVETTAQSFQTTMEQGASQVTGAVNEATQGARQALGELSAPATGGTSTPAPAADAPAPAKPTA